MNADLLRRPFIKICGVTTLDDTRHVIDAGASAIGLNFATSPRAVSPATAARIATEARGQITRVAVFRDRSDEEIQAVLELVDVDAVQLHDTLSSELVRLVRARGLIVIKALVVTSDEYSTFDERAVDAVLLDGPRAGSGETYDWQTLRTRSFNVPVIGAGGLREENVCAFIDQIRPWGVDTASGVEQSPGRKDAQRVTNFVANARRAFERLGE